MQRPLQDVVYYGLELWALEIDKILTSELILDHCDHRIHAVRPLETDLLNEGLSLITRSYQDGLLYRPNHDN
jgi:hypothetical protein